MNEFTTKMQVCHAQPRQKRISRQKRPMPITESEGEKRGEEGRKDDQSVWSGGQKPHGLTEETKAERILRTVGS